MAYETILGFEGKVTIGSDDKVLGMGTWNIPGITRAVLDSSEFGDRWAKKRFGRLDSGQVTFDGFYIPDDETGQAVIIDAEYSGADLTDLKFWFDTGLTSGFFAPNSSTSTAHGHLPIGTPLGWINIVNQSVGMEQTALATLNFTGEISYALARYNADGSYWRLGG